MMIIIKQIIMFNFDKNTETIVQNIFKEIDEIIYSKKYVFVLPFTDEELNEIFEKIFNC